MVNNGNGNDSTIWYSEFENVVLNSHQSMRINIDTLNERLKIGMHTSSINHMTQWLNLIERVPAVSAVLSNN